MKRRDLLNFSAGLIAIAGAAMLATTAQAAPMPPVSLESALMPSAASAEPAVVSQDEVDHIKPEQVHWHHHHHWHHHWHHRHWRHHHWHHHHWHHRHW